VAKVVFTPRARRDLGRVEAFSAGALALVAEAIEMLKRHPLLGRPAHEGVRELIVSRGKTGYVVLYRFLVHDDLVRILGIRHQRELWGTN
jgi:plasmid stabilization system protein ParE